MALLVAALLVAVAAARTIAPDQFAAPATAAAVAAEGALSSGPVDVGVDRTALLSKALAEAAGEEEAECLQFLIAHMPPTDLATITAGFLLNNTRTALLVRHTYAWARDVPWDVFLNDVLPYAALAEPRDPWRLPLLNYLAPLLPQPGASLANGSSLDFLAELVNTVAWKIVDPPIKFVAAPPDELNSYGVFSTMRQHNSSCTGLAVFLVASLRSVGIPARVAGVPHWNKGRTVCPHGDADAACGNHNWVEMFGDDGAWHFMDPDGSKTLDTGWFYPGDTNDQVPATLDSFNHSIFATSWADTSSSELVPAHYADSVPFSHFPMVWDWQTTTVAGWDRTAAYHA